MSDFKEFKQRLKETQNCVLAELKENHKARTNDKELILGVLKRMGIDTNLTFSEMPYIKGFPSFESITRARRKVQSEYPELKDAETEILRAEREQIYKENARESI